MIYRNLPPYLYEEAFQYVQNGKITGAFLEAVLANELCQALDFFEASGRDPYSAADMKDFVATVAWVSEHCPAKAKGSRAAITVWCDRGGISGIEKRFDWSKWAADVQTGFVPMTRSGREFFQQLGRRGY
jgi:hypothetical protein